MYKYLLFDLDHTLLDFNATEDISLKKLFTNNNLVINDVTISKYKEINSKLWRDLENNIITRRALLDTRFEIFFKHFNIDVNGVELENEYRSYLNNGSEIIKDADNILKYLKDKGYHIYAATNGSYETQVKRLKDSNLLPYFDALFISEFIGHEKPSKDFFTHCIKHLPTTNIKEILMIGDNKVTDINGANNVGIDTCYFNNLNSYDNATYSIKELKELLNML